MFWWTVLPGAKFVRGMIMPFYGALGDVPDGWAFCDGTLGTPDLRGVFIKGAATAGGTGGAATHDHAFTPSGSCSAPSFTGNALPTHLHAYTPGGTCVFSGSGLTGHYHDYTPSGSNSAPAFTGSALATHTHTFAGDALATHTHTFAGDQLAVHTHTFNGDTFPDHDHKVGTLAADSNTTGISVNGHSTTLVRVDAAGTAVFNSPKMHTVTDAGHGHTISGKTQVATIGTVTGTNADASGGTPSGSNSATSGGTPAGSNSATSGGTPAGTVAAPVFTGAAAVTTTVSGGVPAGTVSFTGALADTGATSAGTPSGSVSAPAFTGAPGTTGAGNNEPPYMELLFIMKL